MNRKTCSECSRPVTSRGWCKPHYDAWARTGDPKSYQGDKPNLKKTCAECSSLATIRGWCRPHYSAWTRTGDPKSYRKSKSKLNKSCHECSRPAHTRGWCKSHYDAWSKTGDPKSYRGDRSNMSLWDKILEIGWTRNEKTGCNEWNGSRNELGYGQFRPGRGRLLRVHRIVYEILVGPLTDRDHVLHTCDNPCCSEPGHLKKGDHSANMHDMHSKKRGYKDDWTHCPNNHPYDADAQPPFAKNKCLECTRERNRRYYVRKKLANSARVAR